MLKFEAWAFFFFLVSEAWAFQPLAKQKRPIQKEAVQNLGHLDLTKIYIYI